VKSTQVRRVRRSLEKELPAFCFDDAVVEYLASTIDGDTPISEDVLVEQWSPFLISANACVDEDEMRNVCCGLLARLQSEPRVNENLENWLEKLYLQGYSEQVHAWCAKTGFKHLSDVLSHWEEFADALGLKVLERRRVERFVKSGTIPRDGAPQREGPQFVNSTAAAGGAVASAPSDPVRPGCFGPPENLERYVLLEQLGEGMTAKVHRCARGREFFAVKTISLSKLKLQRDSKRAHDRLQREVSFLFTLRHPQIVSLIDVVEQPDTALHLVMEYVEGGDLFKKIVEHGSFGEVSIGPKPLAKHVFVQIANALHYVHSKNIVHRDLKPENILVDERASVGNLLEVKLSDFGHSKLINDGYDFSLTVGVGTPQYWAPEVSHSRYDQRVDLWSIGVVLYVMLLGTYPFEGSSRMVEDQMRHEQLAFKSPAGAEPSQHAKSLIRSLLKVRPEDRLPLDRCLVHVWVTSGNGSANTPVRRPIEQAPNPREVRVLLPTKPNKNKVQMLRADLLGWQKRYCCAATVRYREVVACYGDMEPDRQTTAHRALVKLLEEHFPEFIGSPPAAVQEPSL